MLNRIIANQEIHREHIYSASSIFAQSLRRYYIFHQAHNQIITHISKTLERALQVKSLKEIKDNSQNSLLSLKNF